MERWILQVRGEGSDGSIYTLDAYAEVRDTRDSLDPHAEQLGRVRWETNGENVNYAGKGVFETLGAITITLIDDSEVEHVVKLSGR